MIITWSDLSDSLNRMYTGEYMKRKIVYNGPFYASTDAYFPESVYTEYEDSEPEANMEVMICQHCAGLENVDLNRSGPLRCSTCGGTLSRIEEISVRVDDEIKDDVREEKPAPWWQKLFNKELR